MTDSIGSYMWIFLAITVVWTVRASEPPDPDHFWPLNSKSYGFDVRTQKETASFFGENYIPGVNGFLLDGFSHVTIDIDTLGSGGEFTLLFSIRLDISSQGPLFQYRDSSNTTLLTAALEGDSIKVTITTPSSSSVTLTSNPMYRSSTTSQRQVMIYEKDGKWNILLDRKDSQFKDSDCELRTPGKLRFGAGFDKTKSVTGIVSQIALFRSAMCAEHVQSSYMYIFRSSPKWTPPVPMDEKYKKGYFQLRYRDAVPDSSSSTLAITHVNRRHGCGSICLQYFYCRSFASVKSGEGYKCYLYRYIYTTTGHRENALYYLAKKLED